jgi:hypothetical protein
MAQFSQKILLLLTLVGAALGTGCSSQPTSNAVSTEQTQCSTGMAQLAVGDSSLHRMCGCNEGTLLAPLGTAVTCTVPVGTVVYFHYLATELQHAIVSKGAPQFISSPVSDPSDELPIRVHVIRMTTAGTYEFEDAFNTGISGRLIAQ